MRQRVVRRAARSVAVGGTAALALMALAAVGSSPAVGAPAAAVPGDQMWERVFGGYTYAAPQRVLVSDDARVYVAGTQETDDYNDLDYVLHTYNKQGDPGWSRTYAGKYDAPSADTDALVDMALSGSGKRIVVTGTSEGRRTASDIATVSYRADGSRLWVSRYDGAAHGADAARAVTVATDGTVYVAGQSHEAHRAATVTIAYGADGTRLWTRHRDAAGRRDDVRSVLTSPDARRILVVGSTKPSAGDRDITAVAYRRDGRVVWQRRVDIAGGQRPVAAALAPDGDRLYIAATSNGDYLTLALGPRGAELWRQSYDGSAHAVDAATDAVLSPDGTQLYVTGTSDEGAAAVTTVAYAADGTPQWTVHLDAATDDAGAALAASPDGDAVYVEVSEAHALAVVAYTPAGSPLWTGQSGLWDSAQWRDVAASPDGSFAVAVGGVQDVYWKASVTSFTTR